MLPKLRANERGSKPHTLEEAVEDERRPGEDVGVQSRRISRDEAHPRGTSGLGRRAEEEGNRRRPRKEREEEKQLYKRGSKKEEKEKEKEEGEKRGEGRGRREGSRGKLQTWRQDSSQEELESSLRGNRNGPQPQEEKETSQEGPEQAEEDQRIQQQYFGRRGLQYFDYGRGAGLADGPISHHEDFEDGSGHAIKHGAQDHDSIRGGSGRQCLEPGRGSAEPHSVSLHSPSLGRATQWWCGERGDDDCLRSRHDDNGEMRRSPRLPDPEIQESGIGRGRPAVATCSKVRNSASPRAPSQYKVGVASSAKGVQDGPTGEECTNIPTKRRRQRKDEGQGERQREEQEQRGGQEELRGGSKELPEEETKQSLKRDQSMKIQEMMREKHREKGEEDDAEEKKQKEQRKDKEKKLLGKKDEDGKKKGFFRTKVRGPGKDRKRKSEGWKKMEGGRPGELPKEGVSFEQAAATAGSSSSPNGLFSTLDETSGLGRGSTEKSERSAPEGSVSCNVGEFYSRLEETADVLLDRLCRTMPTGRLFPLPTSPSLLTQLLPNCSQTVRTMLRCLLRSLNSLNGEGDEVKGSASEFQTSVIAGLSEDCVRVSNWEGLEVAPNWEGFLRVRGVDYKGDEILTAQSMCWDNVSPALPKEVGGVKLEDVVELGCKHYVLNFEEYLLDPSDQVAVRPPKVMVPPEHWSEFCENLLDLGVFSRVHEDDIYKVEGKNLLNGLFGVSKNEYSGPHEIMRIIMNLIPLNGVCRNFDGDIATLPSWAGMTPLNLQPHEELVVSSEDVRCFFYIFKVPENWHKYLAFNRPLPEELCGDKKGRWYPCSAVLPMGFKNSVSLAQHVHRFIVKNSLTKSPTQHSQAELRKDRSFPMVQNMYRIYLDNFDELGKTPSELAEAIQGTVSPLITGLREEYAALGVPRHPKKAVSRASKAEVQGAIVDGQVGIAHPKVEKVWRYVQLARALLEQGVSSQKQMQIVGGGLVYMAMFRRPLLGSLNHIWEFIVQCEGHPPVVKFPIPHEVRAEIVRFLGLVPLAYMDFRANISPWLTASDASTTGGGVTVSNGLTPTGAAASHCTVRGDIPEVDDLTTVLTIGLFDGIAALRVAADALGWVVPGHISVEKSPQAARVVESRFGSSIFVQDVQAVDRSVVQEWSQKFTQVSVIILGAGPPCQGVSGLNAAKKGALKDARSSLFLEVPRIRQLVKECFPWAQVRSLMESVASMSLEDQNHMSEAFGSEPVYIDAAGVSPAHRPRLYWVDWEIEGGPGRMLFLALLPVDVSPSPCRALPK